MQTPTHENVVEIVINTKTWHLVLLFDIIDFYLCKFGVTAFANHLFRAARTHCLLQCTLPRLHNKSSMILFAASPKSPQWHFRRLALCAMQTHVSCNSKNLLDVLAEQNMISPHISPFNTNACHTRPNNTCVNMVLLYISGDNEVE